MIKFKLDATKSYGLINLEMDKCELQLRGDLYYFNLLLKNVEQDPIDFIKNQFDCFKTKLCSENFLGKLYFAFDLSDEHVSFLVGNKINSKVINFYVLQSLDHSGTRIKCLINDSINVQENMSIVLNGCLIRINELYEKLIMNTVA